MTGQLVIRVPGGAARLTSGTPLNPMELNHMVRQGIDFARLQQANPDQFEALCALFPQSSLDQYGVMLFGWVAQLRGLRAMPVPLRAGQVLVNSAVSRHQVSVWWPITADEDRPYFVPHAWPAQEMLTAIVLGPDLSISEARAIPWPIAMENVDFDGPPRPPTSEQWRLHLTDAMRSRAEVIDVTEELRLAEEEMPNASRRIDFAARTLEAVQF